MVHPTLPLAIIATALFCANLSTAVLTEQWDTDCKTAWINLENETKQLFTKILKVENLPRENENRIIKCFDRASKVPQIIEHCLVIAIAKDKNSVYRKDLKDIGNISIRLEKQWKDCSNNISDNGRS